MNVKCCKKLMKVVGASPRIFNDQLIQWDILLMCEKCGEMGVRKYC